MHHTTRFDRKVRANTGLEIGIDQFIRRSFHPLGFGSAEARDVIEDGGQLVLEHESYSVVRSVEVLVQVNLPF